MALSLANPDASGTPYRATKLWQEVIESFRAGMPRKKKWYKMRLYDECFTGTEAVEWLHVHLQTSGLFGTVSRQQAEKLLQKFVTSDVITDVKGKLNKFDEEGGHLYQFVTTPGPLNFIEEEPHNSTTNSSTTSHSPLPMLSRACTPRLLGKRNRARKENQDPPERGGEGRGKGGGTCFTNTYAFMESESSSQEMEVGSPVKKSCSDGSVAASRLAVIDMSYTLSGKLTPAQIAGVWKELTLTRLLRLVELPTLDGVLAHDAVDGKHIVSNVRPVTRAIKARLHKPHLITPSTHHSDHESVSDVPQWVVLAIRCLSKWPDGCTEEFVGGMPIYCGFELDVLKSLLHYFGQLPEPLISTKLYDLHTAVLKLLSQGRSDGATDALQLCSLLLPQTNRMRLHRVLRLIKKAGANSQLHLSRTQSNRDVLLGHFTSLILCSSFKSRPSEREREDALTLVGFMSQHYQKIFKVPGDLKDSVQKRLHELSTGKSVEEAIAADSTSYCQRVSQAQYEQQTRTTSQKAMAALLDGIITDQTMPAKTKRHRLKMFQLQYPEIYAGRFKSSSV